MTYTDKPLTDKGGYIQFCRACYPMLWPETDQIHNGHYKRGWPNTPLGTQPYEDDVPLEWVEEAVALPGAPGLLLLEYVTVPDRQLLLCKRHDHGEPMRQIRFSSVARMVHE